MGNANGNSLNLKFFGIDITIAFFVLVAGAKEVCSLVMIKAEDFKVVDTMIEIRHADSAARQSFFRGIRPAILVAGNSKKMKKLFLFISILLKL